MTHHILRHVCTALGISIVLAAGCSSSGVKRSEKALSGAQTLRKDFESVNVRIDTIVSSLQTIQTTQADGLKKAFKKFNSEVKKLDSDANRIISRSSDLRARSRTYIETWEKQLADVRNPELREQAEQRRAAASAKMESIKDELSRLRKEYDQYYTGLSELKVTLENDLNPAGIASIKSVIDASRADAVPLQNDINTIIAGLDEIIARLSGLPVE